MTLDGFREYSSKNVVDYFKVVDYLVRTLESAKVDANQNDLEIIEALEQLIERTMIVFTHQAEQTH